MPLRGPCHRWFDHRGETGHRRLAAPLHRFLDGLRNRHVELPRVPSFAALVSQQIYEAETWRAIDLRPLRRLGDIYGRVDAASVGMARLVYVDSCQER